MRHLSGIVLSAEFRGTEELFVSAHAGYYNIGTALELGLECIVEDVESTEQVELLKSYSCFKAQGYFFDKPLPVSVFHKKL